MGLINDNPENPFKEAIPGSPAFITSIDKVVNWARSNSLWPLTFGTSCCAIEVMMAAGAAHHDLARFGAEVARPSPRQADLLVIAGTIVKRMEPLLKTLYDQMAEPKYVIATGACAISGGPFIYDSYTTIRGAHEVIPVDVYVPGCPPRPEAFFYGLLTLQKMIIEGQTIAKPFERRKPVLSVLPPGIKLEQIRDELVKNLTARSVTDLNQNPKELGL